LISIYNLVLGLVGFDLGLVNYGLGLGGSGLDSITANTNINLYVTVSNLNRQGFFKPGFTGVTHVKPGYPGTWV